MEAHPIFRQRINVRRLHPRPRFRVAADGAIVLIVREDEEDVWPRSSLKNESRKKKKEGEAHDGAETTVRALFLRENQNFQTAARLRTKAESKLRLAVEPLVVMSNGRMY